MDGNQARRAERNAMTLEVTGVGEQSAWTARELPPVERLREGVWSIPIPCALFPIRYTFCYALVGTDGRFILVDPGWDSPEGRARLLGALEEAGLSLAALEGVVITHAHADHINMAHWLVEHTGAWAGMHPREAESVERSREASHELLFDREQEWLRRMGVPEEVRARLTRDADLRRFAPNTRSTRALDDGDPLPLAGRSVVVQWTPGHSVGHICLIDHDSRAVLTGDHILPWITPNVGLTSSAPPDRDSISEYAWSLRRGLEWDAYEAFPAHQFRFRGIAERCRELLDHQHRRQDEVEAILAGSPGATIWEVASRLSWSRGWESLDEGNLRGALAETLAHVRHVGRRP